MMKVKDAVMMVVLTGGVAALAVSSVLVMADFENGQDDAPQDGIEVAAEADADVADAAVDLMMPGSGAGGQGEGDMETLEMAYAVQQADEMSAEPAGQEASGSAGSEWNAIQDAGLEAAVIGVTGEMAAAGQEEVVQMKAAPVQSDTEAAERAETEAARAKAEQEAAEAQAEAMRAEQARAEAEAARAEAEAELARIQAETVSLQQAAAQAPMPETVQTEAPRQACGQTLTGAEAVRAMEKVVVRNDGTFGFWSHNEETQVLANPVRNYMNISMTGGLNLWCQGMMGATFGVGSIDQISFKAAIRDGMGGDCTLRIYADDLEHPVQEIFVGVGQIPQTVTVDLKGITVLRIEAENHASLNETRIVFYDVQVVKN